ncbi:hypothetical protein CPB86DRAFT_257888 [Serendipita vermifera]|nr:hypothetical protein CPB86DRAFT_257888 [Serendipita vermifera]
MMAMDTRQDYEFHPGEHSRPVMHQRPSSWHSEHDARLSLDERPFAASEQSCSTSRSHKRSVSRDGSVSTSKSFEHPSTQAAYRLFKQSIKQASDSFGPYLPPDDGSPFLAHRLTRMWNDLEPSQRDWWCRKAAGEILGEHSAHVSERYPSSPTTVLSSSASGPCTPSSTSAMSSSALGAHYSPLNPPRSFLLPGKAIKLESRSPPTTFMDEDVRMSSQSFFHSRSGSPSPGEEMSASGSHIPRPPNAWILYRSTMSKTRRSDGSVYSPPEISVMWKDLSTEEKEVWYDRAKEAKQLHEAANPGYRYQPNRKKPYNRSRQIIENQPTIAGGASTGSSSSVSSTRPSTMATNSTPWHTLV